MENYVLNTRKRRVVPQEDILVRQVNVFPRVDSKVYRYGVYCECGAELLIKNREPFEPVLIKCPKCGFEINLG